MLTIHEFVQLHNTVVKDKITQEELTKNLQELMSIKNIEIILEDNVDIIYILPCVVEGINFGDLQFKFQIKFIKNAIKIVENQIEEGVIDDNDDRYDLIEDDVLGLYEDAIDIIMRCSKMGLNISNEVYYIAPHIAHNRPCFGEFLTPLFKAIESYDYCLIGIILQDYIASMDKDSHYYYNALYYIAHFCSTCDEYIEPIIYKTLENKDQSFTCEKCQHAK